MVSIIRRSFVTGDVLKNGFPGKVGSPSGLTKLDDELVTS